jgi:signal peptidase I
MKKEFNYKGDTVRFSGNITIPTKMILVEKFKNYEYLKYYKSDILYLFDLVRRCMERIINK